jgi:hypothetical protein
MYQLQRSEDDEGDPSSLQGPSTTLHLARNMHKIILQFDDRDLSLRARTSVGDLPGTMLFTYIGPPTGSTAEYYAPSRLSNLPASGSPTLTIVGYGFTMGDATPNFRSGGTAAEATSWVADTIVICRAASGSTTTSAIALSIEEYINTETEAHSYDSPKSSALRSRNSLLSQAKIIADGKNFASKTFTIRTSLGHTPDETTRWFSDTSILTTRSTGLSQTRRATFTMGFGVGSLTEAYSFDKPESTGLIWDIFVQYVNLVILIGVPNFPPVAKGSIFIAGTSFGISDFSSQGRAGSSAQAVTVWFSTTLVRCKVVNGISASHRAVISAGSEVGKGSVSVVLTFDRPVVFSILVSNAPMSGSTSITLSGVDFGTRQSSVGGREIASGCESTFWVSDSSTGTKVAGQQNYPTGVDFKTVLTTGVMVGTFKNSLTYDTPSISIMLPANLRTMRGAIPITIIGSRVAHAGSSAMARLGLTACERSVWRSASELLCSSPSGIGDWQGIQITIGGQVGQFSLSFTYDKIMLSALHRRNYPSSSLPFITVFGSGMARADYCPKISLAASAAESSRWSSDSSILTRPSSGYKSTTGFASNIVATIGVACKLVWASSGFNSEPLLLPIDPSICPQSIGTSSFSEAFSYDVPGPVLVTQPSFLKALTSIYSLTPNLEMVTVSGLGFGLTDYSLVLGVGSTHCEATFWISASNALCKVSTGLGSTALLAITSGATQGRTDTQAYSYFAPRPFIQSRTITISWKYNHPVTGSTPITIQAVFLGLFSVTQDLRAGVSNCESSVWISDTIITGSVPAGVAATKLVAVSSGQRSGTATVALSFDVPVPVEVIMSAITPFVLTVIGKGMTLSDYSPGTHTT